jgi:hypothetical protein
VNLNGVYPLVKPPLGYPSQGKNAPEDWITAAGRYRGEKINRTHHNAGTSRPNIVKLAVDVPNGVLGRRHGLQTGDDVAVWILELFGKKGVSGVVIEKNGQVNVYVPRYLRCWTGWGPICIDNRPVR